MTGLTDTEHVVAAFSVGSADYVTKPIRPTDGAMLWQTPLSRTLMHKYGSGDEGRLATRMAPNPAVGHASRQHRMTYLLRRSP